MCVFTFDVRLIIIIIIVSCVLYCVFEVEFHPHSSNSCTVDAISTFFGWFAQIDFESQQPQLIEKALSSTHYHTYSMEFLQPNNNNDTKGHIHTQNEPKM